MKVSEFKVTIKKTVKSNFNDAEMPVGLLNALLDLAHKQMGDQVIVLDASDRYSSEFKFIFRSRMLQDEIDKADSQHKKEWDEANAKKNTEANVDGVDEDIPF